MTATREEWLQGLLTCSSCPLRREGNRGPTQNSGPDTAPLMFVGEGPGSVEDEYGVPLVGPSGQLLDKALWSVGLTRDKVYVTNIVKCRPRNNRTPTLDEGKFCANLHLTQEIAIVRPAVIVCLGKVAFQYFCGQAASIMRNRGKWLDYDGIPVMPTYHPAFLLRQQGHDLVEAKWQVYYDLKNAVEKAKEAQPDYAYQSPAKTDLLAQYAALRQNRHL
ncbi:uracil-DNA glycosylase [Megasphaera vaginalis (ex Srinivasan et al. 2021)]|uniref:Type-4 uracil-DNA glycosylase n=1 Tax=Megasphaera vaginalis (ex Srinivasan et al. 2021) TaxID=1111454 RepID=U7UNV2_9FIRM|nr:uracil-DNA glycosylase [Megasphaera vaginalis (ex Srinivasan et al. 2021)]ERT60138.1 putative uracil-DNA glycosylase A [Megasphaera vaginalis (ex Srinivasan et al. 2021)]